MPVEGCLLTAKKSDDRIEKLAPVLTVKRAAEVAGKSRSTIRAWVRDGLIRGHRPPGGGSTLLYIDTQSLLARLMPDEEGT